MKAAMKVLFGSFVVLTLLVGPRLYEQSRWSWYRVVRVVDGDTIVVRPLDGDYLFGDPEKIRLIGVDTPETVDPRKPVQYFGLEATAFTRRLVEGKRVRLKFDYQQCSSGFSDLEDRYGRTLAYVYLDDYDYFYAGTMLNAEIIREGYGFAYTKYPFCLEDDFRQLEREAREACRGLWKEQCP